jgi:fumarylacetoacetase
MPINETHDPNLKSWVESANDPATDFPIQNLPLCVFYTEAKDEFPNEEPFWYWTDPRVGVPIGNYILDLRAVAECLGRRSMTHGSEEAEAFRILSKLAAPFDAPSQVSWLTEKGQLHPQRSAFGMRDFRRLLMRLLSTDCPVLREDPAVAEMALRDPAQVLLASPCGCPNYTDFYASIHHASTVGSMFRPDNPLLPNYKHIPIGYHGRASSIVSSGTDIRRPRGQQSPPDNSPQEGPSFGPCKLLDYEMEVGFFVGPGNELGQPIDIARAEEHIFGLCLVNDWSARDIQKWEYQPLGPFLAKSFATSISPCIVTLEALEPFRCPAYERPAGDPRPLPYLYSESNQQRGGIDLTLEVYLQSEQMRQRNIAPMLISKSNAFREMYWTIAQMLTHHASNGCNMQPGDLLASGTVSGRGPTERGCLLEHTWQGTGPDGKPLPRKPIQLPTGETRIFLQDGDEVIMKGYCEREGFRRIGFGECRGRILPAIG